jgi:hypothetical protein
MRLPNFGKAAIAEDKIVRYLLSSNHPAGGSKAAFFLKHGFKPEDWQQLARALETHASDNDVATSNQSQYGTRYVIDGALAAPDGTRLNVRSVWFIRRGSEVPTFATAHPLERKSK